MKTCSRSSIYVRIPQACAQTPKRGDELGKGGYMKQKQYWAWAKAGFRAILVAHRGIVFPEEPAFVNIYEACLSHCGIHRL